MFGFLIQGTKNRAGKALPPFQCDCIFTLRQNVNRPWVKW